MCASALPSTHSDALRPLNFISGSGTKIGYNQSEPYFSFVNSSLDPFGSVKIIRSPENSIR